MSTTATLESAPADVDDNGDDFLAREGAAE